MNATSSKLAQLATKLKKKGYRDSYLSRHLRLFLANQIRAMRGNLSQAAFGKKIGKPQSVVSRLESSEYGKVTLQTLLDIASKLDVALLVRFVSFPSFLEATDSLTLASLKPEPFSSHQMKQFLAPAQSQDYTGDLLFALRQESVGPVGHHPTKKLPDLAQRGGLGSITTASVHTGKSALGSVGTTQIVGTRMVEAPDIYFGAASSAWPNNARHMSVQ